VDKLSFKELDRLQSQQMIKQQCLSISQTGDYAPDSSKEQWALYLFT